MRFTDDQKLLIVLTAKHETISARLGVGVSIRLNGGYVYGENATKCANLLLFISIDGGVGPAPNVTA